MTPKPPLLTKRQAAEILQQSIPTLDRKIRAGELRAVYLGRQVRIEPDDLEAYINRHESRAKSVAVEGLTRSVQGE